MKRPSWIAGNKQAFTQNVMIQNMDRHEIEQSQNTQHNKYECLQLQKYKLIAAVDVICTFFIHRHMQITHKKTNYLVQMFWLIVDNGFSWLSKILHLCIHIYSRVFTVIYLILVHITTNVWILFKMWMEKCDCEIHLKFWKVFILIFSSIKYCHLIFNKLELAWTWCTCGTRNKMS